MAVKTEKEIEGNTRELWLKALSAMELKNYGYAVSLLHSVLGDVPEFLAGRQLLRKAQIGKNQGKKGFLSGLSKPSLGSFKNKSKIEKDPHAAMAEAEKMLDSDPGSTSANRLLKDAALAADMPEVALFALETLRDANRKDTKILHELGELYMQFGEPAKAVDAFNKITEINPNDLEAIKRSKDASAQVSMATGGWEEAGSYRDVIKDKEEAVSLEQQSRVVRGEEAIDNLLEKLSAEYEENPENIEVVKRIAGLYEQKDDPGTAAQWYDYAFELSGKSDSSLRRKASDLHVQIIDREIRQLEESLEAAKAEGTDTAELEQKLEKQKHERAETMLKEARTRVENHPTDLQLHFQLAEQLFHAGHYEEAMPALQKAKQNSNVKIRASNLLGQCMLKRKMYDMAANQFKEAAESLSSMDSTKKDILYNLALTYEHMGKKDEYLDIIKKIFEVDMGYKDVAERVQKSYEE